MLFVACGGQKKEVSGTMAPTDASRELQVPVLVQRCRLGPEALRQMYECTSAIHPSQN